MTADDVIETITKGADAVLLKITEIQKRQPDIHFRGTDGPWSIQASLSLHQDCWLVGRMGRFGERGVKTTEELADWVKERLFNRISTVWRGNFVRFHFHAHKLVIKAGTATEEGEEGEEGEEKEKGIEVYGHQDMVRAYFKDEVPLNMFMEYLAERAPTEWAKLEEALA